MRKKKQTFEVSFRVIVDTTISITADTYEEALERARGYEVRDIVSFETDYVDGKIKVTGVATPYEEM